MPGHGFLIVSLLTLAGCGCEAMVPVADLTVYRGPGKVHVVTADETLYSIAWATGLDYRHIAYVNALRPPYRLKTGQRLRVAESGYYKAIAPVESAVGDSRLKQKKNQATENNSDAMKVGGTSFRTSGSDDSSPAKGKWIWPVRGRLLQSFASRAGSNGIDIGSTEGTLIRAAAGGKVVYAGSGLRGYGNLLIIKHSSVYLSAYAHNRRLLVAENDLIKAGATIAEMGKTGTFSSRLHFEIRYKGRPVDPLDYLEQH